MLFRFMMCLITGATALLLVYALDMPSPVPRNLSGIKRRKPVRDANTLSYGTMVMRPAT